MSEKTEPPSPRKLREASRKGQLPRSALFSASLLVGAGLWVLSARLPSGVDQIVALSRRAFSEPGWPPNDALQAWGGAMVSILAPFLIAVLCAGLTAGLASAGLKLDLGRVSPSLERVDPFAGLGKLLSPQRARQVLKGVAIAIALAIGALSVWKHGGRAILWLPYRQALEELAPAGKVLDATLSRCAMWALALGTCDLVLARRRHRRDLMMTREEARREHRESEGDPRQKGMRRSLQRQLASAGPARGVKAATAVVVNPTHLAVALRYVPEECEAPYIVARGKGADALRLKQQARAKGIPVVRDVPLARSLIHYDVGEEVPEELYQAAAAVLQVAADRLTSPSGALR